MLSAKLRNPSASRSRQMGYRPSSARSARESPSSYLRWRGIEATLALAQSQNSKIVVIGSGKDGLPIILGNVDTPVYLRAPGLQPGPGDKALPSGAAAPPPPASATQTPPRAQRLPEAEGYWRSIAAQLTQWECGACPRQQFNR